MLVLLGFYILCIICTWIERGFLWSLVIAVSLPAILLLFLAAAASIFGYLDRY